MFILLLTLSLGSGGHKRPPVVLPKPSQYDIIMQWVDTAAEEDTYVRIIEHQRYREKCMRKAGDGLGPTCYSSPWLRKYKV